MQQGGMETAAGESRFENLCGRETLLQKRAFGDEVVVSQIRTNTDIFTIFAALFTFNRIIFWKKQSKTIYQMLEQQGNTYAVFTKISTFELIVN